MSRENTTPLISKTAFSCPHCGAYSTHYWYKLFAQCYSKEPRIPNFPTHETIDKLHKVEGVSQEIRGNLLEWGEKMLYGNPFLEPNSDHLYNLPVVENCYISRCFNCKEITVWVHNQIVYPNTKIDIQPNNDLPGHIRQLFEEAREIAGSSPKGAAALLRLCVQYLCKELGQSGTNLDKDIANLVAKGLNPHIQQALDVVRVIGNESVHPGEIDLNDNKEVAIKLFDLVNLICEHMISHPRQVEELYNDLPQAKLEGIKKRNNKARGSK